jgi:hypothetical protein
MRACKYLLVAALMVSGCTRVVTIEAQMPPLLPVPKEVQAVSVGAFTVCKNTPPDFAAVAARSLTRALGEGRWYKGNAAKGARITVTGDVACQITNGVVRRPDATDPGRTAKTRSGRAAVTYTVSTGQAMKLFTVTETPNVLRVKRRFAGQLPEPTALVRALLDDCATSLVADISPRVERVRIPRPMWPFGSKRTRRGIDQLAKDPGGAIIDLTGAVARDPEDSAALNALGFCSEVTGNLELALSSYMYAAAIDDRDEYRANMERVHDRLARKKSLLDDSR